jgi:uncharacterized membrane protein HdeD (DUF308 family)
MTIYASPPVQRAETPVWLCLLLGLVFVAAGIFVLGDVVLATIVSAWLIGIAAIVGGVFELIHAFWTKGWGGFVWQIALGLLYIVGGLTLVTAPVSGSMILTWVLGIILVASGIVRLVVGFQRWADAGWLLAISGVFAIAAGLVILVGWPATGLWVLGFLLGVDLLVHGAGWLVTALPTGGRSTA